MYRSRQVRFVAALIALFSMLFMQLAVASYACPGMTMGHGDGAIAVAADSAGMDMTACQGMDDEQPSLCHAYGQAGNQSLDKPELPQVPAYVAIGLALPLIPIDVTYRPTAFSPEAAQLTRSTAPPLSIRNCCFRI
jgi:hypothetical protein